MSGLVKLKQLAQSGASTGQVATFDGTNWVPETPATSGGAVLNWGAGSVSSTTTTRYLTPGYEAALAPTTQRDYPLPPAGTVKNLFVHHDVPAGNGNDIVYTVRKNGVATALVATLASTGSHTSNLVDTVAFAAGD